MKRLLILSLCASMLLSCFLTGCNNTADPAESTGEATATEKATTQETEPAGTTSEETESETEPVIDNGPMPEAGQERSLSNVAVVAGDSATEVYAAAELTKYLELAGVNIVGWAILIELAISA